jgi:DNA-binding NtrC family response regulator
MADVPILLKEFITQFCLENGYREKPIDPNARASLGGYSWPGNVRELKNIAERLVIMSGDTITINDLPKQIVGSKPTKAFPVFEGPRPTLRDFRETVERQYILETLEENDWNISKSSQVLGIERTNLHKKLKSLGLKRNDA